MGGEDVSRHKPDPESLLLAMEQLGVGPEEVLYVGDSVSDARAAQRAGVRFVAALSGPTPREAFEGDAVYAVIESLIDLNQNDQLLRIAKSRVHFFRGVKILRLRRHENRELGNYREP